MHQAKHLAVGVVNEAQPLGRYLLVLLRAFENDLLGEAARAGYGDITMADFQILHFVRPEGSLAIEISALAGITKQGVGKAVASLEARGYLVRKASKEDARAKVVAFTGRGLSLFAHGVAVIRSIERRYEQELGAKSYLLLRESLGALINLHPMFETKAKGRRRK